MNEDEYLLGAATFLKEKRDYSDLHWDSEAYRGWRDARDEFLQPYKDKIWNALMDLEKRENFAIDSPIEIRIQIDGEFFDLYI